MRRIALTLMAGLALAGTAVPASAMSSLEAYVRQGFDVEHRGYEDVSPNKWRDPLRVIERKRDRQESYDLPDTQNLVSPAREIHTDHDDPYGPCGAFFVEIKAGTKSICVFEGPQVGMSLPAVYETVDGGQGTKAVCKVTTKTMTGHGIFGSYSITRTSSQHDGAC